MHKRKLKTRIFSQDNYFWMHIYKKIPKTKMCTFSQELFSNTHLQKKNTENKNVYFLSRTIFQMHIYKKIPKMKMCTFTPVNLRYF